MLVYSVIASPGYFAQQGQWLLVLMFLALLTMTVGSLRPISREIKT
jgi:NADH:ubiquinone oxidoreductase subunit 2 (subunit N)